jgi:hypothetical protein
MNDFANAADWAAYDHASADPDRLQRTVDEQMNESPMSHLGMERSAGAATRTAAPAEDGLAKRPYDARNATIVRGISSLKLTSDPLGSPFLNDFAEALDRRRAGTPEPDRASFAVKSTLRFLTSCQKGKLLRLPLETRPGGDVAHAMHDSGA